MCLAAVFVGFVVGSADLDGYWFGTSTLMSLGGGGMGLGVGSFLYVPIHRPARHSKRRPGHTSVDPGEGSGPEDGIRARTACLGRRLRMASLLMIGLGPVLTNTSHRDWHGDDRPTRETAKRRDRVDEDLSITQSLIGEGDLHAQAATVVTPRLDCPHCGHTA
ncbi:hypothetical protein B0T24DRAFT_134793 [Lasiosphaeria ovina]|uniref:Uncharacterized protein n=1 Tax=Lasiosphaeria ovina TaxID=92902 RepID=A0AAE0JT52_9PEZI|nr:hypothetical protein B0T24DRAFT_134793 [Lasiosphaeria ovina]